MKKPSAKKSGSQKENELQGLFAELKSEYLESFSEKIDAIEKFWQKRDRKNLQNEFHKIKGTGSTYGVQEATVVANIMQDLCEENSKHLGVAIMIAIDAFKKICYHHENNQPMDLAKEKFVSLLRKFQSTNKAS